MSNVNQFVDRKVQTLENKEINGGQASNQSRIILPKGTTAELAALEQKEGLIAFDTTLGQVVVDNGSGFTPTSNPGDITAVNAGVGLDGGGSSGDITIDLADTAVTPGSYTSADITVDAQGRITAAASGAAAGANTALSNLASTAVNASIVPAAPVTVDLGSGANNFATGYIRDLVSSTSLMLDADGGEVFTWSTDEVFAIKSYNGVVAPTLRMWDKDQNFYVGLKSPNTLAATTTYTLPSVDGTSGQVLQTNGAGVLSFATAAAGANTALSNLITTSINQDLLPSASGLRNIGNSSLYWSSIRVQDQFSNSGMTMHTAAGSALELYGNVGGTAAGRLYFRDLDSSNYVGFKGPDVVASNFVWTLPDADGTSGQVLSTNGAGILSFITPSGGSFDPDTSPVQFLNAFVEMRDDAADWWSGSNTKIQNGNAMTDSTLVIGTHDLLTGGDVKKNLTLSTGTQDGGPNGGSGQIDFLTGYVWSGTGNSGDFFITTGGIGSGVTGNSGAFNIQSGDNSGTGSTGAWNFRTGNASAGNSGNVTIATGTASGTRGAITLDGTHVDVSNTQIKDVADPTSAQDAATKNYVDTNAVSQLSNDAVAIDWSTSADGETADTNTGIRLRKVGDDVTLVVYGEGGFTKNGANNVFVSGVLPADYRPLNYVTGNIHAAVNGTKRWIFLIVYPDGSLDFWLNEAETAFANADVITFPYGTGITWVYNQ